MAQPKRAAKAEGTVSLAARRAQLTSGEDARTPAVWLVLALVIEQPSHGYEICQRYKARFGSLLPMSVPRVYAALDRLREEGMIEPATLKPVDPSGRQHLMRRSYRATRAGVRAYRSWVAERMSDDPQRPQVLGRIATAGLDGIDAVIDVVERYDRASMEELRALGTDDEHLESGRASIEELTEALIRDQRRRELAARHDWAVYARQVLEGHKRSAMEVEEG